MQNRMTVVPHVEVDSLEQLEIEVEYAQAIINGLPAKARRHITSKTVITTIALNGALFDVRLPDQKSRRTSNGRPIVPNGKGWTPAEERKLKKLYPTTPMEQLEKIFKRDERAISSKAFKLGVKKKKAVRPNGTAQSWSDKDISRLKQLHGKNERKEIAKLMKRSLHSINYGVRKHITGTA